MEASKRAVVSAEDLWASRDRWQELAEDYETALQEVSKVLDKILGNTGLPGHYVPEPAESELRWCSAVVEAALNGEEEPCRDCLKQKGTGMGCLACKEYGDEEDGDRAYHVRREG